MAKGKNYGPDFMGRPRMRKSKHPHLEIGFGPYFERNLSKYPLSPCGLPLLTPLEVDLIRQISQLPEITFQLPDQMSESDFLPVGVVCDRLEEQTGVILELQGRFSKYRTQLEVLPELTNVRLHFLAMDEMDKAGAKSGCSAEELVDFVLSEIYENFRDRIVIALTPPSQQLLSVMKERAAEYPDDGRRFLTLADVFGAESKDSFDRISQPDVYERYISAAVAQVYNS